MTGPAPVGDQEPRSIERTEHHARPPRVSSNRYQNHTAASDTQSDEPSTADHRKKHELARGESRPRKRSMLVRDRDGDSKSLAGQALVPCELAETKRAGAQ